MPFCEEYGVGLVPYYPLACGLLTGKHRPGRFVEGSRLAGGPWTDVYRSRFVNDRNWGILEQLESFAAERRHSVTELAFAWLIAHPIVRSVTAGATSPEQVEANAKAASGSSVLRTWRMSAHSSRAFRPPFPPAADTRFIMQDKLSHVTRTSS